MINEYVRSTADSIVRNLDSQSLQLHIRPDSPVSVLASSLIIAESEQGPVIRPLNELVPEADRSTELLFDKIATEIASSLSGHLNYARNIVAPTVGEFAESIIPAVDIATKSKTDYIEIVEENIPTLALNDGLGVNGFAVNMSIGIPRLEHENSRSDEDILQLMLTGKAGIDADIQELCATLPNGALSQIWDCFFSNKYIDSADAGLTSVELMSSTTYGLTRSLVVYLVASKLSVKAESDCNCPASIYTDRAIELRNQAGSFVKRYIKNYQEQLEDGVLILASVYPKVYVNGAVYRKFLMEGGSTDIILGRVLSKGTECTLKGLASKAKEYESAWRAYETQLLLDSDNIRHTETIRVLRLSFPEFLYKLDDSIAPEHTRARVINLFEKTLGELTPEMTKSIYEVSLKLLCDSLFGHTDAYSILRGVSLAHKANPKATPAECASVSVQEYLGSWIASCLIVSKR